MTIAARPTFKVMGLRERGAGGGADLGHRARGDVDRVGREAPGSRTEGSGRTTQIWPSALLLPWPVVLGADRRMVTRGCSLYCAYRVVSAVCEGVQRDAPGAMGLLTACGPVRFGDLPVRVPRGQPTLAISVPVGCGWPSPSWPSRCRLARPMSMRSGCACSSTAWASSGNDSDTFHMVPARWMPRLWVRRISGLGAVRPATPPCRRYGGQPWGFEHVPGVRPVCGPAAPRTRVSS